MTSEHDKITERLAKRLITKHRREGLNLGERGSER